MGKRQFKQAIKNKDFNIRDMEIALEIWRNNSDFKSKYELNNYVNEPQKFVDEILGNEKYKLESEIKLLDKEIKNASKEDFLVVHDDKNFILLAIGNWITNGYFARNFLRQPKDEKKFGSGPTWCIADDVKGGEMWESYEFDYGRYPNVYMLLSKKDSTKRYQITFTPVDFDYYIEGEMIEKEDWNDEKEGYDEYEEEMSINDVLAEVRNFDQTLTERGDKVYEDIKNVLGITKHDIGVWLKEKKNGLQSFKSNKHDEKYQIRNKISSLEEEKQGIKEDYIEILKEELEDIIILDKKKYPVMHYAPAFDLVADILANNKNIKHEYLRIIFDLYYCIRGLGGRNIKDNLLKYFSEYDFSLSDMKNIIKAIMSVEPEFKASSSFDNFVLAFIKTFHNKKMTVEEVINLGYSVKNASMYFYHYLDRLFQYEILDFVDGDIFKFYDSSEDFIKNYIISNLQKYEEFDRKYNDYENFFIECCERRYENQNITDIPYEFKVIFYLSAVQNGEKYPINKLYPSKNVSQNDILNYFNKTKDEKLKMLMSNEDFNFLLKKCLDYVVEENPESIQSFSNIINKMKKKNILSEKEIERIEDINKKQDKMNNNSI